MFELDDGALVAQTLAGDRSAFSALILRHERRVYGTLFALLPLADEVEDLVQEAFLLAFLNLESLQNGRLFRPWVCGIGINLVRMFLRQNQRLHPAVDTAVPPTPEQQLIEKERLTRLYDAIADLPEGEREALLLIYQDGMSHRETAVQLNITLTAVKVRAHRGRKRLKQKLLQKEHSMIPITIFDLLSGIQPEALRQNGTAVLAPLIADLPQAIQEEIATAATLSVSLPMQLLTSLQSQFPDHADAIHDALRPLFPHRVVLLKEQNGERVLPIWIGPYEAELILVQMKQTEMKRPLSYDLFKSVLDAGETAVVRANISRLHDKVFFGELIVKSKGQETAIDCRPSDALTLATRLGFPIFVAPDIMNQEGQPLQSLQSQQKGQYGWERNGRHIQMESLLGQ